MGVGGNFWDLLKPYAKAEGFDFLRNKRVAVDLSFWIVQQETALRGHIQNPHIRLTFFRTINLFSKFGAFPVFVTDGTPSPLKSQARIERWASGVDLSSLPVAEEGISIERNKAFLKCVQECVELLELLGVPVLKAKGEAEALCAQLNREGHVDACITADSDVFLFGAKCVIKHIQPNSKEPLECYQMSDIESGLGLRRNHLIAVSLLVGNDHNLGGVPRIGLETALRFVKSFSEDEILNRLQEIGRGDLQVFQRDIKLDHDTIPSLESPRKTKLPHCSFCGHPGSKKAHVKFACEYCSSTANEGCIQKPVGFKCNCSLCDLDNIEKEQKRNENWQIRVCRKIALEHNFPNKDIMEMYLSKPPQSDADYHLSWASPKMDMLVDYLAYYQQWEPSYTRQRMLPMLSTIFLRDMASNAKDHLLCGQFEFDSIQRVKTRYGHQVYVINWKKATRPVGNAICIASVEPDTEQELVIAADESTDLLNEPAVPEIHIKDSCSFLSTEEDMELVRNAYPEKVFQFLRDKDLKEIKSSRKRSVKSQNSESPSGVQLSITNFYRSNKVLSHITTGESETGNSKKSADTSEEMNKEPIRNYSKSARRKLLFG